MHNAILFDILLERLLYMYMNEIVHDMILAWFPAAFHHLQWREPGIFSHVSIRKMTKIYRTNRLHFVYFQLTTYSMPGA